LVANHFFVKVSDSVKNVAIPSPQINCVNPFLTFRIVKPSPANTKSRTGGRRNGTPKQLLAYGSHAASDIVGVSFLPGTNTFPHIIGVDYRMAINAYDDLSPGHSQRQG